MARERVSVQAGWRRSPGVEVLPIVRKRGSPPTVTQGKPGVMIRPPVPHRCAAAAYPGSRTKPTQLLDRGVRLLSQRYVHEHSAQFLAVCSLSILAETLGYATTFSSLWHGKWRGVERHKPLLTAQRQLWTHTEKLSDAG